MNFLAHLVLSGNDNDLMLGNFIADAVRSKQWDHFKPRVVEGIRLHHKIDRFTDHHPVVERSKKRLRARHGKYSPVVIDIVYDHFLASRFSEHTIHSDLSEFAASCYTLFHHRWDELPLSIRKMLPYMERGNWLVNYQYREGLHRALSGMSRRASFANKMEEATEDVFRDYALYREEFQTFFPLLKEYIHREIEKIAHELS